MTNTTKSLGFVGFVDFVSSCVSCLQLGAEFALQHSSCKLRSNAACCETLSFLVPSLRGCEGAGPKTYYKKYNVFDFLFLLLVVFIFLFFPSSFECSITIVQLFKESKNAWCMCLAVWHFNRAIFEQHVQLSRLESASSPGGLSLNSTTVRLTLSGRQFSPHVPVFRWCLGVPGELSHVLVCCLGYIWYMDHGYIYIWIYEDGCRGQIFTEECPVLVPAMFSFSSLSCSHQVPVMFQSCCGYLSATFESCFNHVLQMSPIF